MTASSVVVFVVIFQYCTCVVVNKMLGSCGSLKNLRVLELYFSRLESPGKRLVLESFENLLNSIRKYELYDTVSRINDLGSERVHMKKNWKKKSWKNQSRAGKVLEICF